MCSPLPGRRLVRRTFPLGAAGLFVLMAGVLLAPVRAHADVEGDLGSMLQHALYGGGLFWSYLLSFAAGLATSLTPCVYPLIPITVSLFGARDDEVTRVKALGLAACYVGGIAVMYSGLGVFFGLTGKAFGTFMASPYVIVPIAAFFLAMAVSMFGAFELGLPAEVQGKLSQVGGKGPGGAFLMGLVAGVIAAPCTGPPLAALLAFVSTQRSVAIGGSLLFVYALGLGMLFFAIAGFSLKLPRSGPWMDAVKSAFGVVMIVAALYFLRNVVPPLQAYSSPSPSFLLIQAGLLVLGGILGGIHLSFHDGLVASLRKGTGVLLLCVGLFGVVSWLLTPRETHLVWIPDEAQALQKAAAEHRPLLIDFRAEWCLPCKKMEAETFSNPEVARELGHFVLARIDCTTPDDKIEALQKRYDADTLPAVVINDSDGKRVIKLSDFTPPSRLLPLLRKLAH